MAEEHTRLLEWVNKRSPSPSVIGLRRDDAAVTLDLLRDAVAALRDAQQSLEAIGKIVGVLPADTLADWVAELETAERFSIEATAVLLRAEEAGVPHGDSQ